VEVEQSLLLIRVFLTSVAEWRMDCLVGSGFLTYPDVSFGSKGMHALASYE